jgi:hypothetical protein
MQGRELLIQLPSQLLCLCRALLGQMNIHQGAKHIGLYSWRFATLTSRQQQQGADAQR